MDIDTPGVQSLSYDYDASGYLATASDGAPAPWGFDLSYDYDELGRLASVTGGSELPYALSLAYTAVGGLESKNDLSYSYDELPHAPATVGGSSLTYDDNGNRATLSAGDVVTTYTLRAEPQDEAYDEANHLTQVLTASGSLTGTVHYLYTATSRSASSGDGALALRVRDECDYTLYVGDRHEERGSVTTVDGDPPWEACDAQQTSYFYAGGQAVALRTTHPYEEEPYQWVTTSTVYYLHHDYLGNLSEVTDETGEVVGSARYDAFGRLLENSIPPMVTLRLYSGSIYDPDTGLYKIGARWYDPVIGLWLTPDAIVPDVNNPMAWNGYAFNCNNPVNFVDPSGHFALPAGLLLIAAAGFLGGEIYAVSQGYNALDLEFWQYSFEGAFLAISAYFSVADVALMAGYGLQGAGMWVGPRFFGPRLFGWGMRTAGLGVAMYAWAFQPLRFRPYWKVEWVGGGGGGGLGYDDETPGSLPPEWTRQIQEVVDETGVPINVVGGYARGDPHPRKDIDYYVEIPLRDLWTQEMRAKLPGPSHFVHNDVLAYELGWTSRPPGLYRPYIQFSPGQPPVWVRAPWMN